MGFSIALKDGLAAFVQWALSKYHAVWKTFGHLRITRRNSLSRHQMCGDPPMGSDCGCPIAANSQDCLLEKPWLLHGQLKF